jgi:pimeloyl-ACP methyl ester carboxylesterase
MSGDGITRRAMLKQAGVIGAVGVVNNGTSISTAAGQAISEDIRLPVPLSPGGPTTDEIAATLTLPPKETRKPIVQLLVHGLTYGRYYHDFPYKPDQYSYVKHATEAGYPTLNIDRIGDGESSHPAPEEITLEVNAFILHQLIQALRAGDIGGTAFRDVMLMGHGYGALIAVKQQAQYNMADSLVLTGYTQQYAHSPNLTTRLSPPAALPAHRTEMSRFDDHPSGYRTSATGERSLYYYKGNTDPAVIVVDDRHRQTVTETELETATEVVDTSLEITVPVLEVVGDQDSYFCGSDSCTAPLGAIMTEPILWPQADFTMEVIPAVGHALFLHHSAPTAFSIIETWTNNQLDDGG